MSEGLTIGIEDQNGVDYIELKAVWVELKSDHIRIQFIKPVKVDLWDSGGKLVTSVYIEHLVAQHFTVMEDQPE